MWRTPAATASRTKVTWFGAVVRRLVPRPMRGTSTPASRQELIPSKARTERRAAPEPQPPLAAFAWAVAYAVGVRGYPLRSGVRQRSRQPEVSEDAGVGEPGDRRDRV